MRMTKKSYMIFIMILSLAVSVAAAPQLTISEADFNFGYVPQNSKVSHVFWLKSTGDEDLKITKVIPGCGCTKAPLEKEILAPGDSTRLEVIFSTKKYKNRVSKSPRIETNEGTQPHAVKITTFVISRPDSTYPVIIKPYKLDMSQFTDKVRDEIKFEIKNVHDTDLNLNLLEYPSELCDLTLPKTIKAGETATGILKLKSDKLSTQFAKSITFELNDKKQTRFTIPVKRTIRTLSKK